MMSTTTDAPALVTVSTAAGLRHHKATCNRIRREQIVGDPRTYVDAAIPLGTCCKLTAGAVEAFRAEAKPEEPKAPATTRPPVSDQIVKDTVRDKPAPEVHDTLRRAFDEMTAEAKAVVTEQAQTLWRQGSRTVEQAWTEALNEATPKRAAQATKAQPAKAPAAKKAAAQVAEPGPERPDVTFYVNGKPRLQRTSPRPYTFSYLAGETVGGKGSSAKLRDMLTKAGITDPEHTSWDYTLPNGKTIGARIPGDAPPAVPQKPSKEAKAAGSAQKLDSLKAESEAMKAWKAGGEEGPKPETPLTDAYNAAEAEKKAAAEKAKTERAEAGRASKRQEAAKGAA